jgi:stage V sporulation protein SpoVS
MAFNEIQDLGPGSVEAALTALEAGATWMQATEAALAADPRFTALAPGQQEAAQVLLREGVRFSDALEAGEVL